MTAKGSTTDRKLTAYRRAKDTLPPKYWLWPLYGAGLESLGREGQPIQVEMPEPLHGDLARYDAVEALLFDTKIITAGLNHPRLERPRHESENPVFAATRCLTVIKAGPPRGAVQAG